MSSAKEALRCESPLSLPVPKAVLALTNKGYRPACSACIGWGAECVYASDPQPSMDYGYPTPDSTLGMDLAAFFQNMPGAAFFDLTPDLALISSEANHGVPGRESNSPISVLDQLPLAGQTVQLIDEFFVRCHPQLPCTHQETFLTRTQGPTSTPLEWAILATAARAHRDATVQSSRHAFASSRGFACTKPSSSSKRFSGYVFCSVSVAKPYRDRKTS
jgi:hypothetical protein